MFFNISLASPKGGLCSQSQPHQPSASSAGGTAELGAQQYPLHDDGHNNNSNTAFECHCAAGFTDAEQPPPSSILRAHVAPAYLVHAIDSDSYSGVRSALRQARKELTSAHRRHCADVSRQRRKAAAAATAAENEMPSVLLHAVACTDSYDGNGSSGDVDSAAALSSRDEEVCANPKILSSVPSSPVRRGVFLPLLSSSAGGGRDAACVCTRCCGCCSARGAAVKMCSVEETARIAEEGLPAAQTSKCCRRRAEGCSRRLPFPPPQFDRWVDGDGNCLLLRAIIGGPQAAYGGGGFPHAHGHRNEGVPLLSASDGGAVSDAAAAPQSLPIGLSSIPVGNTGGTVHPSRTAASASVSSNANPQHMPMPLMAVSPFPWLDEGLGGGRGGRGGPLHAPSMGDAHSPSSFAFGSATTATDSFGGSVAEATGTSPSAPQARKDRRRRQQQEQSAGSRSRDAPRSHSSSVSTSSEGEEDEDGTDDEGGDNSSDDDDDDAGRLGFGDSNTVPSMSQAAALSAAFAPLAAMAGLGTATVTSAIASAIAFAVSGNAFTAARRRALVGLLDGGCSPFRITNTNTNASLLMSTLRLGPRREEEALYLIVRMLSAPAPMSAPLSSAAAGGGSSSPYSQHASLQCAGGVAFADFNGVTALHIAAEKGAPAVVRLLLGLDAAADVFLPSYRRGGGDGGGGGGCSFGSAKGRAVHAQSAATAITTDATPDKGNVPRPMVSPNARTFHGCTALYAAVRGNRLAVAEALLLAGADANAKDYGGGGSIDSPTVAAGGGGPRAGWAPSASASAFSSSPAAVVSVSASVSVSSSHPHSPSASFAAEGRYPLHYAVVGGHLAMVRLLARHGARLDCCASRGGYGALQFAVDTRRAPMVRLLLELGADPNGVIASNAAGDDGPHKPHHHHGTMPTPPHGRGGACVISNCGWSAPAAPLGFAAHLSSAAAAGRHSAVPQYCAPPPQALPPPPTPLYCAADRGLADVCALLIDAGAVLDGGPFASTPTAIRATLQPSAPASGQGTPICLSPAATPPPSPAKGNEGVASCNRSSASSAAGPSSTSYSPCSGDSSDASSVGVSPRRNGGHLDAAVVDTDTCIITGGSMLPERRATASGAAVAGLGMRVGSLVRRAVRRAALGRSPPPKSDDSTTRTTAVSREVSSPSSASAAPARAADPSLAVALYIRDRLASAATSRCPIAVAAFNGHAQVLSLLLAQVGEEAWDGPASSDAIVTVDGSIASTAAVSSPHSQCHRHRDPPPPPTGERYDGYAAAHGYVCNAMPLRALYESVALWCACLGGQTALVASLLAAGLGAVTAPLVAEVAAMGARWNTSAYRGGFFTRVVPRAATAVAILRLLLDSGGADAKWGAEGGAAEVLRRRLLDAESSASSSPANVSSPLFFSQLRRPSGAAAGSVGGGAAAVPSEAQCVASYLDTLLPAVASELRAHGV